MKEDLKSYEPSSSDALEEGSYNEGSYNENSWKCRSDDDRSSAKAILGDFQEIPDLPASHPLNDPLSDVRRAKTSNPFGSKRTKTVGGALGGGNSSGGRKVGKRPGTAPTGASW